MTKAACAVLILVAAAAAAAAASTASGPNITLATAAAAAASAKECSHLPQRGDKEDQGNNGEDEEDGGGSYGSASLSDYMKERVLLLLNESLPEGLRVAEKDWRGKGFEKTLDDMIVNLMNGNDGEVVEGRKKGGGGFGGGGGKKNKGYGRVMMMATMLGLSLLAPTTFAIAAKALVVGKIAFILSMLLSLNRFTYHEDQHQDHNRRRTSMEYRPRNA